MLPVVQQRATRFSLGIIRSVVAMRTVGVEEEFLLIDPQSFCPRPAGDIVYFNAREGEVTRECKQEQIETATLPHLTLEDLEADLVLRRRRADAAAARAGVRIAALATSPVPVSTSATSDPRYLAMQERFGSTFREQLTCGCHVHVAVDSDEEGVGVLDRIRIWLPVLAALSANSPYWNGEDSGYSSYRSQAWSRWPTAGAYQIFGSAAAYRGLVDDLVACEVPIDEGQIYFDARLSRRYPTVEVRVADVCLHPDDAVLQAALTRALVETAAREWADGKPPVPIPAEQLRLAAWRSSRYGLDGQLLDPLHNVLRDSGQVIRSLFEYVRPVLVEQGEELLVESMLRQTAIRGTGCRRQRATYARTGKFADVIADAVFVTNVQSGSLRERHADSRCFHMRGNELHPI